MAHKRSLVWNYFTSETKDLASCNTCGKEVSTGTGSTSGLANHLKVHHVSEYQELEEKKRAKSSPSELMPSTSNVGEYNEDHDDAAGSGYGGTVTSPNRELSECKLPTSAPNVTKHDIYAELTEVSSLLCLAMPTANVNLLADEGMEDEAVAVEVRPKGRPFKENGTPQAKWSAVILWLPSGTICVYVLKMDRRIMECKRFQPGQTLDVVEHVKSHAFINTKWEMCPGARDVVPSLSTFWGGCDSGDTMDYGTHCELLVPAQDKNDMPTRCKFCEPVGSGTTMEEAKNAFKEEDADIDSFGSVETYSLPHEVKVKIEEPEDYPDTALSEGNDEDAFIREDNLGYFDSTNSFNSAENLYDGVSPLKRSKRSYVWDYFTSITKELATCNTCNREIPTGFGSTSGLANHLRSHHKPMFYELQKKKHLVPPVASATKLEGDLSLSEATQNLQNDTFMEKADIKVEDYDNIAPRVVESKRSLVWDYFTRKDQSLVTCNECNKDLRWSGTTSNFAKHLHLHHKPLYAELQRKRQSRLPHSSEKPPSLSKKQHKTYAYKCEPCQMPFKGPHCHKKWARHMQRHKGEPGVHIPPVPAAPKQKAKEPMKPWMCDLCGTVTKYKMRHMASVHKVFIGDKFPCDVCGRVFWQKCELKKHVRTHAAEKSFICTYCGKTFKCMQGRQYCEERCSGNNQKYECSTCGKKFQIKNRLICHMRTHTGERPYACPIPMCNSSYMSSTNLGTHIKQTHKMCPREVRAKLVKQKTWHEARGVNPR